MYKNVLRDCLGKFKVHTSKSNSFTIWYPTEVNKIITIINENSKRKRKNRGLKPVPILEKKSKTANNKQNDIEQILSDLISFHKNTMGFGGKYEETLRFYFENIRILTVFPMHDVRYRIYRSTLDETVLERYKTG